MGRWTSAGVKSQPHASEHTSVTTLYFGRHLKPVLKQDKMYLMWFIFELICFKKLTNGIEKMALYRVINVDVRQVKF